LAKGLYKIIGYRYNPLSLFRTTDLSLHNPLEAQHYRHHSRISVQSLNSNATPKPYNAGTIYPQERRG